MLEVAGMSDRRSHVAYSSSLSIQTYLKFSNVEFRVAASSNHASPSGALPFLLPTQPDTLKPVQPVPSGKLQRWAMNNSDTAIEESGDLRYEAYLSLLDHRIRRAWVSTSALTISSNISNGHLSSTAYTSRTISHPSPSHSISSRPPTTPSSGSQ